VHRRLGLARSSPATQAGWAQPPPKKEILQKNLFQKFVIFQVFLLYFDQYWFVFLYCKDTNPVLKYLVFVKTLKK